MAERCKNTDYIKKFFKQKLFWIKFPTKNLEDTYLYLPVGVKQDTSKVLCF